MPRVLLILFLMISSIQSYALDLDELHLFTDKKGNQIAATLLEVTGDQRTAKIRREDGKEYSPEIVLFSLDDQQYIKDWMEADKLASANKPKAQEFHLTIKVDHKESSTEKHPEGSLDLESTPNFFEVSVLNTSRETLERAVLEYVIIWEEGITVSEVEGDDGWTYTYPREKDVGGLIRKQGSLPLEALAFNRDAIVRTAETPIERAVYSDGDILKEDKLLGVLVRVVGPDGEILAETTSGKSEITSYTWEKTLTIASVDPEED